jgi:hypothetical protein
MSHHLAQRIAVLVLVLSLVCGLSLATLQGHTRVAAQEAGTPSPDAATPVAVGTPQPVATDYAWMQLGPGGVQIARAVVGDAECPQIVVDGVAKAMDLRAGPDADFPVTVCEADVVPDATSVQVEDRDLPLLADEPDDIVVLGDTGCRLKDDAIQSCNDPEAWPFATVATQAAAWSPELVIHVGDYAYRESPCPDGNAGCEGSPYGDTWAAWHADFFAPVGSLLTAAPWLFARGNHEDCARQGSGWFRFFDPAPMPETCEDYTDPYLLEIGNQRVIVLDAGSAQDVTPNDESTAAFAEQFQQMEELIGDETAWLVSHKAFWTLGADGDGNPVEWTTATFREAGYLQPHTGIDLILAGHVHMAQLLWFTEGSELPAEIVAGNGGTMLEWFEDGAFTGEDLGDETLIEGLRYKHFGFVTLEQVDVGWVATVRMIDGTQPASCLVADKTMACVWT